MAMSLVASGTPGRDGDGAPRATEMAVRSGVGVGVDVPPVAMDLRHVSAAAMART